MISIIIPTYNDNESRKLCLKSIAASDFKPLEVIVITAENRAFATTCLK